jgi:Domain of unknown function (DUF397)
MSGSIPGRFSNVVWRKSSRSTAGNQCVEVGRLDTSGGLHAIRDSKAPGRGYVTVGSAGWKAFMAKVKRGDFDL